MFRLALVLSLGHLLSAIALAQTQTTFTYQGDLRQGGALVSGAIDMTFSLWTAPSGGSQIGSLITLNDVDVVGGYFVVELDYGASAFNGDERYLEISVEGFTLAPRQRVAPSPYSVHTRGIFVGEDSDVGLGTTAPFARLDVVTDTTNAGNNTARFSAPNIGPRTSHVHYGPTGDWYLRSADPAGKVVLQDSGGAVGIGTASPIYPLAIRTPTATRALYVTNSSTAGTAEGIHAETDSPTGRAIVGEATATSGNCLGIVGVTSSPEGEGVTGAALSSQGLCFGVVGICNSQSGWDFFAAGPGGNYGALSSRRWKQGVEPISDPLGKLEQLRGVSFNWDAEHGGHHDIGMIAEDVGEVLPEVVTYEDNGTDASGMDYGKITPLLVEALKAERKERDLEISEMQRRIAVLESRIEQLVGERKP